MTVNVIMTIILGLIAITCLIGGSALMFGGLVLMSLRYILVGGPLMFCGIALLVSFDL